jgi:hypothetical protein
VIVLPWSSPVTAASAMTPRSQAAAASPTSILLRPSTTRIGSRPSSKRGSDAGPRAVIPQTAGAAARLAGANGAQRLRIGQALEELNRRSWHQPGTARLFRRAPRSGSTDSDHHARHQGCVVLSRREATQKEARARKLFVLARDGARARHAGCLRGFQRNPLPARRRVGDGPSRRVAANVRLDPHFSWTPGVR